MKVTGGSGIGSTVMIGSGTGIHTSSTGGGGVMISPPGGGTTPSTGWVITCSTSLGTATEYLLRQQPFLVCSDTQHHYIRLTLL